MVINLLFIGEIMRLTPKIEHRETLLEEPHLMSGLLKIRLYPGAREIGFKNGIGYSQEQYHPYQPDPYNKNFFLMFYW